MKKTFITILLSLAALGASAQNAYDALNFSENDYEGSARTVAMGNAFTALGGDLGSISINPAGSAVAKYSQFSLTPALTFTGSTTMGVLPPGSNGNLPYFEREIKSNATRFSMPNIGMTFYYDTNRKSGIKSMVFGFIANKTAGWDEEVYANGTNKSTSFMGAMAYDATINGYLDANLDAKDAYDFMPWKPVVGYQSGMISTFGGYNDQYVGASELIFDNGTVALGGPLKQTYGRRTSGGKYEYLFNFGMNISDFIYLGANLGINSINYTYEEYFKEVAVDPADFEILLTNGESLYFNDMRYRYQYAANGSGFFGKFGIIVTPGSGLRFGAAIQTPVVNTITEEWKMAGETSYTNSGYNASASSPYGTSTYTMVSPFRANFGAAYTFLGKAVISADYEMADYGQMKYQSSDWDDYFFEVNEDIKSRFGISHMLRVGAEFKPIPELAVRAGYGMTTAAEKYDYDGSRLDLAAHQNASFGLGYSSQNSFFADLAVRKTFLQDEYFMPYDDYMFDENGNIMVDAYAPEILNKRSLWKVLITFGWRF